MLRIHLYGDDTEQHRTITDPYRFWGPDTQSDIISDDIRTIKIVNNSFE